MADPITLSDYEHIRTVKMGVRETKTPKDIVGDDDPTLWDLLGFFGTTEAGVMLLGRRPDPGRRNPGERSPNSPVPVRGARADGCPINRSPGVPPPAREARSSSASDPACASSPHR